MGPNPTLVAKTTLLDHFVHPSVRDTPEKLYHARILVAILLSSNVLLPIAMIVLGTGDGTARSHFVGIVLCTSLLLGNNILLAIMRAQGRYYTCCGVAVLLWTFGIFASILLSGGVLKSPVSQLLVAPVLTAYFFGGIRWGSFTALMIALTASVSIACELNRVHSWLPNSSLINTDGLPLLICIIVSLSISSLAFIFEFTATKLRQERDLEQSKIALLARMDPLTGLINRHSFDTHLIERFKSCTHSQPKRQFALCYLDLDGFKPINDRFGHGVGDEVLQVIADRLRGIIRESDLLSRYGGDEFVIVFDLLHSRADLATMAERTLTSISEPIDSSGGWVSVGVSIGFALFPDHGLSVETLRKAAETAMYFAKRGRRGWQLYDSDLIATTSTP